MKKLKDPVTTHVYIEREDRQEIRRRAFEAEISFSDWIRYAIALALNPSRTEDPSRAKQ